MATRASTNGRAKVAKSGVGPRQAGTARPVPQGRAVPVRPQDADDPGRPPVSTGASMSSGTYAPAAISVSAAAPGPVVPPAQAPAARRPALVPPRWVPVTSTVLAVLALLDASYLAYLHFTNKLPLVCPTKPGFINCGDVLNSKYSHPLGIPVVVPGLIWAVAMVVLCSPWMWRAASPWVHRIRLAGAAAGILTVFYLLWAELIKLHHLCEYCTGVHIVTVALFFVVVFGTALAVPGDVDGDAGAYESA